jgi:prephenate dehydrogenase
MIEELNSFKYLLKQDASDNIEFFFKTAKEFRDKLKPSHTPSIAAYSELYVDIEDRPGIIGKITTLLGESGINIKNLRIIHSREDEPEGCLVISFASPESVFKSKNILTANGYKSFER